MGQNICGAMNSQNQQQISTMQDISELDFNRNSTYKKLEQFSITVCKERDISIMFNLMIQRLLSMGQYDLFDHISKLQTQEQKNDYLRYLDSISHEMEVIDSLYHHFMKQSSDQEDNYNVDIIQHIENVQNSEDIAYDDYERLYSTGLRLIRQKQVALVIMAGGRNLRFDRDLTKCASDLGLPSASCMIELIGRKLWTLKEIAFANSQNAQQSSFQLFIVINYQNSSIIKNIWQKNNYFGFNETDVTFIFQNQYPITDNQGKLLLKNDTQCHLFPCGNGDVVLQLIHNKYVNRLVDKGYKYVHFIGVDNLLVKPLDPLFLGIASENKKSINQKIVQVDRDESEFYRLANINGRASLLEYESVKKLLKQKTIHNSPHIPKDIDDAPAFLFNTLISVNFLVEFSRRVDLKQTYESKFRVMKRYLNFPKPTPTSETPFSQEKEETNVLVFEKQIGDMLELTDDINFLLVHKAEEFAPIIYKKGKYSPEDAIISLSNLHKRWLRFEQQEVKETDLIEVCPQISYAGEGLDKYALYLKNNWISQQFPLYIHFQKINSNEINFINNDTSITNGNQYQASFVGNEDKKLENASMYHSIDAHIQNVADQSFTQRKETDLIYKSFNNLVSGSSNRQIPISSKNIQKQMIIDNGHHQQGNEITTPVNNNNFIKIQYSNNQDQYQNDNIAVKPTNQVVISQKKINSMNEIDQKSSTNTKNTQDA